MTHRFTKEELETKSDNQILYWIINDKWAKLQPDSPLRTRLEKIIDTLNKNILEEIQQYEEDIHGGYVFND